MIFFNAKTRKCKFFLSLIFLGLCVFAPLLTRRILPVSSAEDVESEIEKAIYTRQEFFGTEAIVRLPTAQVRENLAKMSENQSDNSLILEKLADAEEKLERFADAEKILIRLAEIDEKKAENLSAFYERRAEFSKQADVLRKILFTTSAENRANVFEKLINLARIHDLNVFLSNDFYAEVAKENPHLYEIFAKLIDNLTQEKNYSEALKFVRQAKTQFPEKGDVLLEKEIEILLTVNQTDEAEVVYRKAFSPFWTKDEAQRFYNFLDSQNQLRAYGGEIKNRFTKNPADMDAALRLAQYRKFDYEYDNDEILPIILKLEQAKTSWTTEELSTISRILLQENELETASRFLYTLFLREDFKKDSPLRAGVLYQLFRTFCDAEKQKLPLTKGDLRFYEDVAKTDTKPGIATGILSLFFSDTNPRQRLDEQEERATKFFNRAAAYRIFEEYKKEFPTSPELAQMYLDIVQIYTAEKQTEIAENILNEFAERDENSTSYADIALKLAEAFAVVKKPEKEREIYQKVLDYLGKTNKSKFLKADETSYGEVLEKFVATFAKEKKTAEILALYSNEIKKYPTEETLYEQRLSWLEKTNLTQEKLEIYKTALAKFQTKNWRDKLARFFLRENRKDEFVAFAEDLTGKSNDAELQTFLAEFVQGKISATDFDKNLYLKLYQSAQKRFPHNLFFVKGLLNFYKTHKRDEDWRKLSTEYYFESAEVRENFLNHLAERGALREYLAQAQGDSAIYELFRADVCVRLSDFENAVVSYRKLNAIYPHEPQFTERILNLTRSFGQKNRNFLTEAAEISASNADFFASSGEHRTQSGELQVELGNYEKANAEWRKLLSTANGTKEVYLETATVQWDYFQYDDALATIKKLREKFGDETLYAFEVGAIFESQNQDNKAFSEYIKALGDDEQKERARKRLVKLFNRETRETRENILLEKMNSMFSAEKNQRENSSALSLGYAEFLFEIKQKEKAEKILNTAIGQSADTEFLETAREFYQSSDNFGGERIVLKKLAETAKNPRQKIQFQFSLAESFEENNEREAAKNVLANLVRVFPKNFGVIAETSDFYWRLGFETEAFGVLKNALPQSVGAYRERISEKLVERLIKQNRLNEAEIVLLELHEKDKTNTEIFRQIAKVLVQTRKPDLLRKVFNQTISELKKSDADRREIDNEIAELRAPMIDAFTKLGDYRSAVEEHIEIINREPEIEELTENAIRYVQRYGGAEFLLEYYLKLSAESFKNYRWNVVLARIYVANNDLENALKNYQTAIINQPEMAELYLEIAEIETRRNNFDAAIKNIDEVLTLTNDAPEYVKKKIEILKKAGRFSEIEAEKSKLPTEIQPQTDEFAEARKLQSEDKEKSLELYRQGFAKLMENPLGDEIKSADISAFVEAVREEEPLDEIARKLWNLREKLIEIANETDSKNASEARKRLAVLDGAFVDSVGEIAKRVGTDKELAALHEDWQKRLSKNSISLIQNMSRRAGFGDLEEAILLKKLDENILEKEINLQNLVNFYVERGAYQKVFEALEKHENGNLSQIAKIAKLIGDREKEIELLREIYWQNSDKNRLEVGRYLEILYAEYRDELKTLTEKNSVYQLQLINFLLAKGERELVHQAIENSSFPTAWKVSRHSETSLALREFDENAECYFCEALRFDSIGNLVNQTPDKQSFLINDDWFRLSRKYGEWLFEKKETSQAAKFLPAMIENLPRNADEQNKLGDFYFQKNDFEKAAEHFRLANELKENDAAILANLGAAYLKSGKYFLARSYWADSLADASLENALNFYQTLHKKDLASQARKKLSPIIIDFLKSANAEDSESFQNLIRTIIPSFYSEEEKSAYFRAILDKRPTDKSLAKMLLEENLIGKDYQNEFYELLINRSENWSYETDYEFQAVTERAFSREDAESVFDQENEYVVDESNSEKFEWQKKYLALLNEQSENELAKKLISEIEQDLNGRFARPVWLRLAKTQVDLRGGKFDVSDTQRFVGITVSDSATEIILPSIERFNEVLKILRAEKREDFAGQISEAFFARNLALGEIKVANFGGFSRALFQKGDAKTARRVLRLMSAGGETALAEILAIEPIKNRNADATKFVGKALENSFSQIDALKISAEIAFKFGESDEAIRFRRELLEKNSLDLANKIELAKLLAPSDESEKILTEIVNDRNALRFIRWQVREILQKEIPNVKFDSFSQIFQGNFAVKNGQNDSAIESFINALIADQDTQNRAKTELIKLYVSTEKYFAALKLAENLKEIKSDELLENLATAAEKVGDFSRAIKFEKSKSDGGNADKISNLQKSADAKNKRITDFTVNKENTQKL